MLMSLLKLDPQGVVSEAEVTHLLPQVADDPFEATHLLLEVVARGPQLHHLFLVLLAGALHRQVVPGPPVLVAYGLLDLRRGTVVCTTRSQVQRRYASRPACVQGRLEERRSKQHGKG
ncbi:hypothetical protein QR680_017245 [Steinernema hermaphroditum]|uniref:Uncharacterized protein n=1 Tax=Steinernema hermaphroditum TaxID=289476 RepID=A0AA39HG96_9BILA|nr:hypothetical protein QR680_017245 [Steinernema hermaphroditum]